MIERFPCPRLLHATTCCPQVHDGEEFNTVAAGEEIAVQVTFKNPLAIKLSLSHVRLQVQFTPAGAGSTGAAGAATAAAAAADGAAAAAATPRQDEVVVVESQFSLHPGKHIPQQRQHFIASATPGWLLLCLATAGWAAFVQQAGT
jgi:hypothetical protein